MVRISLSLVMSICLLPILLPAQQQLEIEDFAIWNQIENEQLSNDGRWVTYVLEPDNGDPTVVLYDTEQAREWRFERADKPQFNAESSHLVFMAHPAKDSLREMRRRKVKKDSLPGDTLAILPLGEAQPLLLPNVKSYQLPKKWGNWLAYGMKTPLPDSLSKGLDKKAYRLVFRELATGDTLFLEGVKQFTHAEEGPAFLATVSAPDSIQAPGVYYFDAEQAALRLLLQGKGTYEELALSRNGSKAAFLADRDTTEERIRPFELYTWQTNQDSAQRLHQNREDWMPDGWRLSENGNLRFSHNEERLFFGIAPDPILQDTSLLDEEIVQVEVWATADERFYTREENQLNQDRKRTYLTMYDWSNGRTQQLATLDQPRVEVADRGDGRFAMTYDEQAYLYRRSYEGSPTYRDIYLIDLQTGDRTLVTEAVRAYPEWSPGGKYLLWFNRLDTAYYSYSVADRQVRQLTNSTIGTFYYELHDQPSLPGSYSEAGWMEDDAHVLIYDRYDWWKVDPSKELQAEKMTNLRSDRRQARYIRLDPEKRFFEANEQVLVYLFDEGSRHSGYGYLDLSNGTINTLQSGPFLFSRGVAKAKDADAYLFTKEDFTLFPDLLYTNDLSAGSTISQANPQQQDYAWGTAELVSWTSLDGQQLEGILVKPDGFDPAKKYPMIVNFYERSSNGLYRHRAPYAHRSTINYAYYVSRGYVIFNPDVPYRVGYPGESAYNAVMSGVTALMNQGFVDEARIGVQGHSWGGYQIAQLVTETDLFACAESGAPVVNMISAYGGIRWGSGLSRQFQYEQTQSRIGGTPWEYPMRYIENSPIFFVDKINTPVLIMHNDNDGAVPWYQGIEFFAALRRLGKPAWMLNYNDEPHWPLKYQNRVDFQRRMSQFFDHYLMDGPKPQWMEKGVAPLEKGIRQGYEPATSRE